MTSMAKLRIYGEFMRNCADSFMVILGPFAFFGAPGVDFTVPTTFFCKCLYVINNVAPDVITAPIKNRSETAQASTPGAKLARKLDT